MEHRSRNWLLAAILLIIVGQILIEGANVTEPESKTIVTTPVSPASVASSTTDIKSTSPTPTSPLSSTTGSFSSLTQVPDPETASTTTSFSSPTQVPGRETVSGPLDIENATEALELDNDDMIDHTDITTELDHGEVVTEDNTTPILGRGELEDITTPPRVPAARGINIPIRFDANQGRGNIENLSGVSDGPSLLESSQSTNSTVDNSSDAVTSLKPLTGALQTDTKPSSPPILTSSATAPSRQTETKTAATTSSIVSSSIVSSSSMVSSSSILSSSSTASQTTFSVTADKLTTAINPVTVATTPEINTINVYTTDAPSKSITMIVTVSQPTTQSMDNAKQNVTMACQCKESAFGTYGLGIAAGALGLCVLMAIVILILCWKRHDTFNKDLELEKHVPKLKMIEVKGSDRHATTVHDDLQTYSLDYEKHVQERIEEHRRSVKKPAVAPKPGVSTFKLPKKSSLTSENSVASSAPTSPLSPTSHETKPLLKPPVTDDIDVNAFNFNAKRPSEILTTRRTSNLDNLDRRFSNVSNKSKLASIDKDKIETDV